MAIKKHIFVSANAALLPRWKQAFAGAIAVTPGQLPSEWMAAAVWLRLQPELPANQQIQALSIAAPLVVPLIVLSDLPNDDEAMLAFSIGARGYANSHAAADTLKQIARVVDQGGLWIGESLMQRMLVGMQQMPLAQPVAAAALPPLTGRELEVAQAIAAGASNKEVARRLNITERTVKSHVSGLFNKLGVQDRLQLALKMRASSN